MFDVTERIRNCVYLLDADNVNSPKFRPVRFECLLAGSAAFFFLSSDKNEELIELVRKFEELYDMLNKKYSDSVFKIYRTIISPVVLYGCETWSLTLREERRLRVFANRVLRRVFVPKRDEVTGEWGKLHNEELNDLYSLPNIVRVVKSR